MDVVHNFAETFVQVLTPHLQHGYWQEIRFSKYFRGLLRENPARALRALSGDAAELHVFHGSGKKPAGAPPPPYGNEGSYLRN